MYSRGFIVAMGRDFYDAVSNDPQIAFPHVEYEDMCYFFAHLYRERFGVSQKAGSEVPRGSCSNPAG